MATKPINKFRRSIKIGLILVIIVSILGPDKLSSVSAQESQAAPGSPKAYHSIFTSNTSFVPSQSGRYSNYSLQLMVIPPKISLISLADDGTQANNTSSLSSISDDGRYVAFESLASNPVAGDTNGFSDIFVRDRIARTTIRISISSDGVQGNGDLFSPSISADGKHVAFCSRASNLVSDDTNGTADVFVHDLVGGTTTRVSVATDGTQGDSGSGDPSISGDGHHVAFVSAAGNLVPGENNGYDDVFVHDLMDGTTELVSVAYNGTVGDDPSGNTTDGYHRGRYISADGRYIAFNSMAGNLVPGDTPGSDVFVRDLVNGTTTLVSTAPDETKGVSSQPSISADGMVIAFTSDNGKLVNGDTNGFNDIFVSHWMTNTTTRVSIASDGTEADMPSYYSAISADGQSVVFESAASKLVINDKNNAPDIFIRDLMANTTTRISVASDGSPGPTGSVAASISADGHYVAFYSEDSLSYDDTNNTGDVYLYDREGAFSYSVSGHVMDGHHMPIPDVSISDDAGHSTITDSNGNYTLKGLTAGTHTITPVKRYYDFSPVSRSVSVPPHRMGYDFVAIPQSLACDVPFFWQRKGFPKQGAGWWEHPLRTNNGTCSSHCSTIGACGCTLTSAAMVFAYYGADINPPSLSDCMGNQACPFYWGTGTICSNKKVTFLGVFPFSWSLLDLELNQFHRPVILKMHRKGDSNATHWVVVINGHGNDPKDYEIHDPWVVDGANTLLSARTNKFDLDSLSIYSGHASCNTLSLATLVSSSMPQPGSTGSSSIVTGTAMMYSLAETMMTVQLIAESSAGNITEMLVWTDEITNPVWQPFSTLLELPVSDHVYARFRDEFGNESEQTSDSLYPVYSPPPPLFSLNLPLLMR